ncbi:MAG: DNA gyrase inhibitor YacG [Rhodospirillaceae bacterium]
MTAPCPSCRRRPALPEFHPFCSRRCAERDLARWLDGSYRLATDESPADEAGGIIETDE